MSVPACVKALLHHRYRPPPVLHVIDPASLVVARSPYAHASARDLRNGYTAALEG